MTQYPHLAILVPSPDNEQHAASWPGLFETLAAPLRAMGAKVTPEPWFGGPPARALLAYDSVLPLLAWGYHLKAQAWADRLRAWDDLGVKLTHPARLLAWNTTKSYLAQLADLGAPVVPSLMTEDLTWQDLDRARTMFDSELLVIKPQISAGSHQTMVHFPDDEPDDLRQGPVIVQPFLPAVGEEGEWSLFYFGGQFSHAVIKVARTGDFRVQPQFGGRVRQVMPSPEAFDAAQSVLRAVDQDLVYARIDLIRCLDGDLRLMELELIEPNLFLEHAPDHGAAFADAIMASID